MEDDALCESCGCGMDDVNVEAFELSGKVLCESCSDALFEGKL